MLRHLDSIMVGISFCSKHVWHILPPSGFIGPLRILCPTLIITNYKLYVTKLILLDSYLNVFSNYILFYEAGTLPKFSFSLDFGRHVSLIQLHDNIPIPSWPGWSIKQSWLLKFLWAQFSPLKALPTNAYWK